MRENRAVICIFETVFVKYRKFLFVKYRKLLLYNLETEGM